MGVSPERSIWVKHISVKFWFSPEDPGDTLKITFYRDAPLAGRLKYVREHYSLGAESKVFLDKLQYAARNFDENFFPIKQTGV